MALLGFKEEVLNTDMLWVCSSCYACTVRCPQKVDVKEVMDVLRRMALLDKGFVRDEKRFFTEFLNIIGRNGRLNTMRLYIRLAKKEEILDNLKLGLSLFLKGKIKLMPERLRGQREIEEIFERAKEEGGSV
jgi:heterodisulfide reductase subunit C